MLSGTGLPAPGDKQAQAAPAPKKEIEIRVKSNAVTGMIAKLEADKKKIGVMTSKLPQLMAVFDSEAKKYSECAK